MYVYISKHVPSVCVSYVPCTNNQGVVIYYNSKTTKCVY